MGVGDEKIAKLIQEAPPLEHDPSFFGVNVSNRPVRDVLFGLLFTVNTIAFCVVAFFSFAVGQPSSDNPICSQSRQDDFFNQGVMFLETHAHLLGVAAGIALAFGIVWLFLLRAFTKVGIYLTLAIAVGVVVAGGVYLIKFSDNTDIHIAGYIMFAIAALMLIVIFVLRRKIALTAAIMSEACKALQHNPSTVIVAFVVLGLVAAFIVMGVASLIRLNCVPSWGAADAHKLRYLFIFLLFGGLWIVLFLLATLRVSVSGGVAVWYFSRSQSGSGYIMEDLPRFPTLTALGWSFSTSFGSIAFGSMVLALIATIRFILYRAQKAAGANKIAAVILRCLQCICACIFSMIQYLNEFAYVYIAMYGTSFIDSAKRVFSLIGRNPLSAIMVETLTGVMLLFGRILGTVVCVLSVMAILHQDINLTVDAWMNWTVCLSAIVAFIVLSVFSEIIHCAVDSIFVCYCEDLERNRESGRYLMDASLHQTFQEASRLLPKSPPPTAN